MVSRIAGRFFTSFTTREAQDRSHARPQKNSVTLRKLKSYQASVPTTTLCEMRNQLEEKLQKYKHMAAN